MNVLTGKVINYLVFLRVSSLWFHVREATAQEVKWFSQLRFDPRLCISGKRRVDPPIAAHMFVPNKRGLIFTERYSAESIQEREEVH